MSNDDWLSQPSQEGAGIYQDLRGIPHSPFKNKGDQMLAELHAIRQGRITDSPLTLYGEPYSPSSSPTFDERYPDPRDQSTQRCTPQYYEQLRIEKLREQGQERFNTLIDAQRDLADTVRHSDSAARWTGEMALRQSTMQTGHLDRLNSAAQEAYNQRNDALRHLSSGATHLKSIDSRVEDLNWNVNKGFDQTVGAIHGVGQSIVDLMGEVGDGFSTLNNEMIATRMSLVQGMSELKAVYLWCHRERMWVMQNPRQTQADECWRIGQQCHSAGDSDSALTMFAKGIKKNPADARNYFSTGLIQLNQANPEKAVESFYQSARYASSQGQHKLSSYSLMHIGKVMMINREHNDAFKFLQQSTINDRNNLESMYELALCCIKLKSYDDAQRLAQWLVRNSRIYRIKIFMETLFSPLHEKIRQAWLSGH
jgi:tetratricopeptide (TPR) repeat protein